MSDDLLAFVRELQSNSELHNFFAANPTEVLTEYDLSHFDAQYVLGLVDNAPALGLDLGHLQVADGGGALVSGLGAAATVGHSTVSAILPDNVLGDVSAPDAFAFGQGDTLSAISSLAPSATSVFGGSEVSTIEHSLSSVTSVGHVLSGASPLDAGGLLSSVTSHQVTQETTHETHESHGSAHDSSDDQSVDLHHGLLDNGLLDSGLGLLHVSL